MGKRSRTVRARRGARTVEATERTFGEIREVLERQLTADNGDDNTYCWVRDLTDTWVVYEVSGGDDTGLYQATYSIDDAGDVVVGDPAPVEARTSYEKVTEAVDRVAGRVVESLSDDPDHRIFEVEIINFGESRNGRLYPEAVMREAAPLYEGAKAYDHHRTEQELETSTTVGLVGHYRNVEATGAGIKGELHLLPSAEHTAEILDASLDAQKAGLAPLVGISHDAVGRWKPVVAAGRRFQEAVQITSVNSADVVADPAAGGRATRMVAGGSTTTNKSEEDTTMTIEELLELLDGASDDQRAQLAGHLGLSDEKLNEFIANAQAGDEVPASGADDKDKELVTAGAAESYARDGAIGKMLIRSAVTDRGVDERSVEAVVTSVSGLLGERFTEADLTGVMELYAQVTEGVEKAGLKPKVGHVDVGEEDWDKRKERLYQTLAGNFREGYRSLREAYADITGADLATMISPELPFQIVRESYLGGRVEGQRATESINTGSWGEALGDSMTRRLVEEYNLASLLDWRKIVSSTPPITDFRTQRRDRVGGYGVLPTVLEGGTYQPLDSPGDEEATYALSKKGGTEDFTLEAAANDDLQALMRIPKNLGRSAALTLYRFVFFTMLADNPTLTYDSVALFHTSHANTDTSAALAQDKLSVGRRKMREQARFGVSTDVLGITPKYLLVPPELEETAFLLTGDRAVPSSGNATDLRNIHQGLEPIVIDQWTDANDWMLVADPNLVPTIEIGFFQGRQEPELFVQDDPKVGSNFSADKVTYKIRHIYSGTVLEHRGFYRGQG